MQDYQLDSIKKVNPMLLDSFLVVQNEIKYEIHWISFSNQLSEDKFDNMLTLLLKDLPFSLRSALISYNFCHL